MTPDQCRAGRALVGMTQSQLAELAGIGRVSVLRYERGARVLRVNDLRVVRAVLETNGVEMIDGDRPRVRFAKEARH